MPTNMPPEVLSYLDVSRETQAQLERYVELLVTHNSQLNLIGKSTVEDVWYRHIVDSAQLLPLIKNTEDPILDLGSGAGLPGMVLGIISRRNVQLVEKSRKKTKFLHHVKDDLQLKNISICDYKIEELNITAKCVVSRALAPLPKLLKFAQPLLEQDGLAVFLKGKSALIEVESAKKIWNFECRTVQSCTSADGNILMIKNIKRLNPSDQ